MTGNRSGAETEIDRAYADGEHLHDDEAGLAAALGRQMRTAPWYMSSVGVHVLILLALLALPVPPRKRPRRRTVIRPVFIEEQAPEFERLPEFTLDENEDALDADVAEATDVNPEVNVEPIDLPLDDLDDIGPDEAEDDPVFGDEAALEDLGLDDLGTPPVLSVPGTRTTSDKPFGWRGHPDKQTPGRPKRNKETERAVDLALRWLSVHQEPDGSWDPKKYEGGNWRTGITCLGLLAFLGRGNSTRYGPYRPAVQSSVDWLMRQQKPNGAIGSHRYECGIALMALAEAYGMSGDRRIKTAAEKIADYCVRTQFRCGGWDYTPAPERTDLSVTGWYVMGLKSARLAELKIPRRVYDRATEFFHYATADNGTAMYAMQITEQTEPKELKEGGSPTMGAASLTCMQFLGRPRDDPKVTACAEQQLRHLPRPDKRDHIDYYRLYYQALGMLQMGVRSVYWRRFNPLMKEKLLSTQETKGTFEEKKGSWDPMLDRHGKHWSRVGSTAIACLTLEVYYRYNVNIR